MTNTHKIDNVPLNQTQCTQIIERLKMMISSEIVGQERVVNELIISILANGHSLFVGVPGLAKTLLINTLAKAMGLGFKRIQFTPDLMPSDITGSEIIDMSADQGHRELRFIAGPIFANLVLADEINRASPKTQSALLQAMQEKEVTYAGRTYELPSPFLIFATQNPIEQEGTFPLPEAQLDRFLMQINVDYPTENEEISILTKNAPNTSDATNINPLSSSEINLLQKSVQQIVVPDVLIEHIVQLIRKTRPQYKESPQFIKDYLYWGAGPRAGQSVLQCAKANALLHNRLSVTPADIYRVLKPCLRHRLLLNFKAQSEAQDSNTIIDLLIERFGI